MAKDILSTVEAAKLVSERLLPASVPPRTSRSISRLCKEGKIEGAYRAYGDWCIPLKGLEKFMRESVQYPKGAKGK